MDKNLINCYAVYEFGNKFIMSDSNKKPCLRRCLSLAKKGSYVELWYYHSSGFRTLCQYWN